VAGRCRRSRATSSSARQPSTSRQVRYIDLRRGDRGDIRPLLLPVAGLPRKALISAFSGIRAAADDEDFHIGASETALGFVNVAGIQSPGSPARRPSPRWRWAYCTARGPAGEEARLRSDQAGASPVRVLDSDERDRLIKEDPRYGRVILQMRDRDRGRSGEGIHASYRRPRWTRSSAGPRRHGQVPGGFCGYRVAEILARELGVPVTEITKNGPGSEVFVGETKGP